MTLVPLQAYGGCLFGDNDKLVCVLDSLIAAFGGEAMFGLIISAGILVPLWISGGGDVRPPAVVLILIGSVAIPLLPSTYQQVAFSIVVVGVAAALLAVANRFVLSGSAR